MTTLTKHPAKTGNVGKSDATGDVIYWKGKPMPAIFFDDPEPVEDGMLQQDTITKFGEALKRRYPDDFVKDGGFVMYDEQNGNNRFAADCYISFGVTRDYVQVELELPNYWAWVVEKMIDFALEVASPSTSDNDTDSKRELHERIGVGEYWMLDRIGDLYGKPITGLRLVDGRYEEYPVHVESDGSLWSYSEMLDLEIWWLRDSSPYDPFDLRDPLTGKSICAGEVIGDERARRLAERAQRIAAERQVEAAKRRAEAAERQAESEREARLAAEREARRLRRRLKKLEGDAE